MDHQIPRKRKQRPRLSRELWLSKALEILSREGAARIRVRHISAALGVSTGSFYWHFEDRDDFVQSIVGYWKQRFTTDFALLMRQASGDPKTRLIELAEGVIRQDLARYDVAVRAWAAQEPIVASIVREADEERFDVIRGLFAEIGFRGAELEVRARTFLTYYSLEHATQLPQNVRQRLNQVRRRVEMLTHPGGG